MSGPRALIAHREGFRGASRHPVRMQQTLSAAALEFLGERHLATLTTLRADGSPHGVPVGFTYDGERGVVRVITFAGARKAAHAGAGRRAAVCQVDGGRWITFEGAARVSDDPAAVAEAVAAYAVRYRQPKVREDRVVVEIDVDKVLSNTGLRS
jgi:PPOX class probable F420-dependent enzyme